MGTQESPKAATVEDASTPFEIARDNRAGLRLYKYPRFKQVQLRFEYVVPTAIQERLHQGGWIYRDAEGVYTKQFGPEGQGAAIIQARRLFAELCRALTPQAEMAR
jgi:hypothetical protein